MNNQKGKPQTRGINYEKVKAKAHKMIHVGGPGKPDATKGRLKMEVKDWVTPVSRPVLVKAKRKGVSKFVSKSGFTKPAIEYGKTRNMKLYQGKKKVV